MSGLSQPRPGRWHYGAIPVRRSPLPPAVIRVCARNRKKLVLIRQNVVLLVLRHEPGPGIPAAMYTHN
jgi:hypothetical protein